MTQQKSRRGVPHATTLKASLILVTAIAAPLHARSAHAPHHRNARAAHHGRALSGNQHVDNADANATADEQDREMETRIKSICRGC
jgi:hypothetical protein